jgi:hypothetical protein
MKRLLWNLAPIIAWLLIGTIAAILVWLHPAHAVGADRPCTQADIARFETMFPRGSYHSDPRTQMTLHYLYTKVVNGVCYVAIRPAR